MNSEELLFLKLSEKLINKNRNTVKTNFLKQSKNIKNSLIKTISPEDLELLFNLYDKIFFNYYFKSNFKEKLTFSLSKRMSSNAGKTILRANSYEIVIAVKFLFNYDALQRDKKVNGIYTTDAVNALQLVFEHELCHLIEFYLFKQSDCKNQRFKTLALNLFGHTDVYHQLPTEREILSTMYDFKIGSTVNFSIKNQKHNGIITSINKRATVMVKDSKGLYIDKYNNRYTKWYVPLKNLKLL